MQLMKALLTIVAAMAAGAATMPQAIPVELRVPTAPMPVLAEGRSHLIYELHLTNLGRSPVTVRSIEVIDSGGASLATFTGEGLKAILARPGLPAGDTGDPELIGAGLRAVAFIDVDTPRAKVVRGALRHRIGFVPLPTPAAGTQSVLVGGAIQPRRAFAPLGPPLAGGGWVAMHGLSNASSHRRTMLTLDGGPVIAQRFAVDFTRIGSDGQAFRGNPADNRNWTPYGAPVLAVADATVAAIHDGVPENDPTSDHKAVPIDLVTVGGNWMILALADGRKVFYAHLQPGSIKLRPGQKVRRGQPIGLLGNSGQSDAPHLHIHVVDRPSPLSSEGLPLIFDRFTLQGHLPSLAVLTNGAGWHASTPPVVRFSEMPVENAVVAFPPSGLPSAPR